MSWIISIIALVIAIRALMKAKQIERRLGGHVETAAMTIEQQPPVRVAQDMAPDVAQSPYTEPQPGLRTRSVSEPSGPSAFDKFVEWFKEDWLMKLGAFLIIIGFGWLATYAFLNNWIGPVGRITLGILLGVAILGLGQWRIRTFANQGATLLVLGATAVNLTIFAARYAYDYFTPALALGIMSLVIVFIALSSVRFKVKNLAVLALIGAYVIPTMTVSAEPSASALLTYILLMTAGGVWVVALTGWKELTLLALLATTSYTISVGDWWGVTEMFMLGYATMFAAMFFMVSLAGMLRKQITKIDIVTAFANAFIYTWWIMVLVDEHLISLSLTLVALVFVLASFSVFKLTKKQLPFFLYGGIGIFLIAIATAIEVQGEVLTLIFTFEALALILLVHYLIGEARSVKNTALLLIIPAMLSLESLSPWEWKDGMFSAHFFVVAILTVVFFGLARFFQQHYNEGETNVPTMLYVAGSLYGLALIWLSLHAELTADVATVIALFIYTVIGVTLYIKGKKDDMRAFVVSGSFLLGLVVLRLLFVEFWMMDLTQRIIAFFAVGVLLISTAFIGKSKNKDSLEAPNQEPNNE